ncbi:MAG TPA: hypothetical protein PLY87_02735 [Planctomycetaceae bacterium]|mgnify:FL=1|nr:hypothetical protein [Planctomycetaceae bacterium]
MANVEYTLYRVKFVRPRQMLLTGDTQSPQEIFKACVNAKLSGDARRGSRWHIGNVSWFEDSLGYFRVGKTKDGELTLFDETSGDFIEQKAETSEFAHCAFDSTLGVLGIAKNYHLSPTPTTLANVIAKLFAAADVVIANGIDVLIDQIPDPDDFLTIITDAYQVEKFTAAFTGPNPFDADAYFQKPLSVYAQAADATGGQATIKGADLNREVVAEVARSSAATGNHASARVKRQSTSKLETVVMSSQTTTFAMSEDEHTPDAAAKEVRKTYDRVRRRSTKIENKQ